MTWSPEYGPTNEEHLKNGHETENKNHVKQEEENLYEKIEIKSEQNGTRLHEINISGKTSEKVEAVQNTEAVTRKEVVEIQESNENSNKQEKVESVHENLKASEKSKKKTTKAKKQRKDPPIVVAPEDNTEEKSSGKTPVVFSPKLPSDSKCIHDQLLSIVCGICDNNMKFSSNKTGNGIHPTNNKLEVDDDKAVSNETKPTENRTEKILNEIDSNQPDIKVDNSNDIVEDSPEPFFQTEINIRDNDKEPTPYTPVNDEDSLNNENNKVEESKEKLSNSSKLLNFGSSKLKRKEKKETKKEKEFKGSDLDQLRSKFAKSQGVEGTLPEKFVPLNIEDQIKEDIGVPYKEDVTEAEVIVHKKIEEDLYEPVGAEREEFLAKKQIEMETLSPPVAPERRKSPSKTSLNNVQNKAVETSKAKKTSFIREWQKDLKEFFSLRKQKCIASDNDPLNKSEARFSNQCDTLKNDKSLEEAETIEKEVEEVKVERRKKKRKDPRRKTTSEHLETNPFETDSSDNKEQAGEDALINGENSNEMKDDDSKLVPQKPKVVVPSPPGKI